MTRKVKQLAIDHQQKKIIMGCAFAKRQADTESAEYEKLQAVHREFPDYEIKTKRIKKKENKEAYKGLTYDYMERYIAVCGTEADMIEYKSKRFLAQCHSVRYPAIKAWFLEKYPDVKNFGVKEELMAPLSFAI